LQTIEQHGGEIVIVRGDVTDRKRMQEVVAEIFQHFGAINGVVHAAGVEAGGLIQLRSPKQAASVLAPKVQGLRALEFALKDVEFDFFLLCSSLSSVLGSVGQVDYCAANFFLDSFARYDSLKTGRHTVSVNWDAWQEIGLATRKATWLKGKEDLAPHHRKIDHPLLGECIDESDDRKEYLTRYNVADFWTVDEHRIAGHALLPGTAYLEIARAAFEEHTKSAVLELSDFYFLNIFRLGDREVKEAHTLLEKNGNGFKFVVRSKTDPGGAWQDHAVGKVTKAEPATRTHDLKAIQARCEREIPLGEDGGISNDLGPRWHSLKSVHLGKEELLARIELPEEFSGDLEHFKLHPAIIDIVTGVAKQHLSDGGSYLPLSYKKVSIHAPLPRRIYSYAKAGAGNRQRKDVLTFDVAIIDEEGRELVNIEQFSARLIADSAATIKEITEHDQNSNQKSPVLAEASREKTLDQGRAGLSDGITPLEGVEAFGRILSSNLFASQIVVSAVDIHALIAQSAELAKSNIAAQAETLKPLAPRSMHPRPEMDTPYVEPRNEREQMLAEIWQTFLGIEKIGINDNFFELGGDSVVAIHFIARVNEAGLQLSPQQLFNNPTIAALAAIADELPEAGESPESEPSAFEMVSLDDWQSSVLAANTIG
jgi:aryl carrier-like protein